MDTHKPTESRDAIRMGLGKQRSGDLHGALAVYAEVLEREPRNLHALHLMAVIGIQVKDFEVARDLLAKAAAVDPVIPRFYDTLDEDLGQRGLQAETLGLFRAMLQDAGSTDFRSADLPGGYIRLDLSSHPDILNLIEDARRALPSAKVYHYPQMFPETPNYVTYSPNNLIVLDKDVDFGEIYYLDNPLARLPGLYRIFEIDEVDRLLRRYFRQAHGSDNYFVYHVSLYRSFPGKTETGFQKWYSDQFPACYKKILLYLSDVDDESDGPTQIEKDGNPESLFGKSGTAYFFDVNQRHRGAKPVKRPRDMLAISLCPAADPGPVIIQALGTNAVYPRTPQDAPMIGVAKQFARTGLHAGGEFDPVGINLGGGTFKKEGWINFDTRDRARQDKGLCIFDFGQKKPLPLGDGRVQYAYTSHVLEHLSDEVVDFIFSDVHRVLRPGGSFLIKLPDFETLKERYLAGDFEFFRNRWNIECLEKQWLVHGIAPNLTNYMLFAFAGFSYFGAGSVYANDSLNAYYYGPPRISREEVDEAINTLSIKEFSRFVRDRVPKDAHVRCHINAFTPEELRARLTDRGFAYVCHSRLHTESEAYREVRSAVSLAEFEQMRDMSLYLLVKKSP